MRPDEEDALRDKLTKQREQRMNEKPPTIPIPENQKEYMETIV